MVKPLPPKPSITLQGNPFFCTGDSLSLTITPVNGVNYFWFRNSVLLPGLADSTIKVYANGNYQAEAFNGCKNRSDAVAITVYPLPLKPVISNLGDSLISNYSSGNQWLTGSNTAIGGAVQTFFKPALNGGYKVKVTDQNGCSAISDRYQFYFTGLQQASAFQYLNVYPNPVTDKIYVGLILNQTSDLTLTLLDQSGRLVHIETISKILRMDAYPLQMDAFSAGAYILQIESTNGERAYLRVLKLSND